MAKGYLNICEFMIKALVTSSYKDMYDAQIFPKVITKFVREMGSQPPPPFATLSTDITLSTIIPGLPPFYFPREFQMFFSLFKSGV